MLKKTILLVEDDDNDVYFMQRAFKMAKLTNPLQVVQDGRSALEYLQGTGNYSDRNKFPLPCLLLLDLQLPFVPGKEVLKWIRAQPELQTLNVVVLTSSNEDADIDNAYRMGANAYLVKPPDAAKLLEMVTSIREFWLRHNQPPPALLQVGGRDGRN